MKKVILTVAFGLALLATQEVYAQQGFGTNNPDKSAAVEIVSTKRGLLIPRIDITDLDAANPVDKPAHSLFVFNTNTTTGAGFYYWEKNDPASTTDFTGKWVRFVSSNTERDVVVQAATNGNIEIPAATYVNGVKTYNVSVKGGSADGQVLVTKVAGGTTTTEWVNPNDFVLDVLKEGNAIGIAKDGNGDIEIKFNGTLTENTTIATGTHNLSITGLATEAFDPANQKIMVMGEDGVLKLTSAASLIDPKNLSSIGGIITLNGAAAVNNSVLQGVELGVADRSIAPGKFKAETTDVDKVPVVKSDGTVEWTIIPGTNAAELTTDGKIVIGASEVSTLPNAVLAATHLKIKEGSITSTEIANATIVNEDIASKTIQAGKLDATDETAGHVATVNEDGTVTYQAITPASLTDKKTLETDGVIVIGTNSEATGTVVANSLLADVKLNIGKDKITADHIATGAVTTAEILDGTIQTGDIASGGNSKVMVTDASGNVSWIDQSTLPSNTVMANGTNTAFEGNGSTTAPFKINVATANGTTLGVVKEAATPTVNINANGELAVNLENVSLQGDVTGSLAETVVGAIQGTAVSATKPTETNNVLKYDATTETWVPSQLQGSDIAGKKLSSTTLTVTAEDNKALLEDLTVEITAADKAGKVLTTTKNTAGDLEVTWQKPTASYSTTNVNIAGDTNYSPYISEIVLKVTLEEEDQTVAFPAASSENKGQTISIKIANINENHNGYLNVLDTYGAMPYQGWIVKSNGSEWLIVGRN